MLKTTGARLKAVRKMLGLSQDDMASVLGLTDNAAVSIMERRDSPIKQRYLDVLKDLHHVNPVWLQMGDGEIWLESKSSLVVEEPIVNYGGSVISMSGLRKRYQQQVNDFQVKHGSMIRKDIAKKWHINVSQLNAVMSDLKDVSLEMLLKSHYYGRLNLNYTASAEGGMYIGGECEQHEKRIKELEKVVEILQKILDKNEVSGKEKRA